MKNTIRTVLLSLAVLSGCLAGDPGSVDTGTTTVTLTAADVEGGVTALIDLTIPNVRWVVDASDGPFDVHAFEVRVPGRTLTLADWLIEARAIDEADVEALGTTRLELEPQGPAVLDPGVGQHEQEMRADCDCDLVCDDYGCYFVCVCQCYPMPGGGWRCPLP